MTDIALYCPLIPQNTGNIIRLCANTGAGLHLIHPLGFAWDDRRLKRSGLDYHEFARVRHHDDWHAFISAMQGRRIFALTTRASQGFYATTFREDDVLLFGNESKGLPDTIHQTLGDHRLRLPMCADSRSLNLANTVAITLYETIRQHLSDPANPSL
ncbi:MAG: tRNA (uridine(34)/cytosine(34)/5-carboxymethylaminomethyluridine(34)-2'-O)-methyltransferase TrmL [Cardiobacteriaceae bacterium]|nr:tRNA (uridine(34)/cytosine(34)/5-carboxymethylaminomethyluridine(34)-2'-O)-methyltransferase TrmL [Cardiobacteriaceae bacterium]